MTRTPEACDCGPCNEVLATSPAYLELNRNADWELAGHVYPRDQVEGPEPVYWVWTDGEIFQITNTENEPRTVAGYGKLESLLKLKNIEPSRFVEAERPGVQVLGSKWKQRNQKGPYLLDPAPFPFA